jgi:serine/threonine-protein kinase
MITDRWERVFRLFDAALALPVSERATFLATECADDSSLREEVQALLDADGLADGFLSRWPGSRSRSSGASAPASETYSAGARLGAFLIESFIGAGGMGEVYRARDTRLDRVVAIKVLSPGAARDSRHRTRFAYEARAIARLSHPRICTLHDIGNHEGTDFLVMEYLEGETLATRLARGPLTLPEAMRAAIEIAEALAAAHARSIVHRDLKPSNVMLTESGAKLLDFGLARLRAPAGSAAVAVTGESPSSLTAPGCLAGTMPYMAPEQLRGEESDPRTDVFAFGAVLYEMLAGTRAFAANSQAGLVAAILEHDPPPLSDRVPMAPPALTALVGRCLQKDPQQRWQHSDELARTLKSIAEANIRGTSTRLGSKRTRPFAIGPSGARLIAPLLALLLLLLVGVSMWDWIAGRAAPPLTLAVLPFENLGHDPAREYLADGLTEETSASVGQIDPAHLQVKGRTSTLRYKGTTKSLAQIGQELGADYLLESSIQAEGERLRITSKLIRVRDEVQVWSASLDREAINLLGVQQELSRALAEQIQLRLSPERLATIAGRQSRNAEAYDLYLRGRSLWNQFTPPTTREAIQQFQRATVLDPGYGLAWAGIADAYSAGTINGDTEPLRVMPLAREAVTRAIQAAPGVSEVQTSRGLYEFWLGWNWETAEASLRTAIALDANSPLGHRLLGIVLSHGKQRRDEAAAAIGRARELDPLSAMDQALSAQVAFAARDPSGAIAFARQAIVIDPHFWIGHYQLAQAYEQAGKTDLALSAILDSQRCSGGSNSKTLSLRAYLLAKAGKTNEAREVLAKIEAVSHQRYMPPYATALVHAGLGDREEVFARLEAAYAAHDVHLALLPIDPKWDPYRTDPRFEALVARCHFFSRQSRPSDAGQ